MKTTHLISEEANIFASAIASLEPAPASIWLYGSRANGKATEASDTDFLIFGTPALLTAIKSQIQRPKKIDCLVVLDGDNFQDVWQEKNGSLTKLRWKQVDANNAQYVGIKWIPGVDFSEGSPDESGEIMHFNERAICIWRNRAR